VDGGRAMTIAVAIRVSDERKKCVLCCAYDRPFSLMYLPSFIDIVLLDIETGTSHSRLLVLAPYTDHFNSFLRSRVCNGMACIGMHTRPKQIVLINIETRSSKCLNVAAVCHKIWLKFFHTLTIYTNRIHLIWTLSLVTLSSTEIRFRHTSPTLRCGERTS
jgi:hypothetical protein